MIALVLLLAAQAGDAPPAPDAPPPVEVPPPAADDDDDRDDDDDDDRDDDRDDDDRDDDDRDDDRDDDDRDDDDDDDDRDPFVDVFWAGATGCGVGGVVPAGGAAVGLGLFYGGSACGEAAGVVGGVSGALIGIPSLLLLGPCAGGGAACGAAMGAVLSAQDPINALFWSLPGIGLGIAAGVVASVGVLVSSSPADSALGDAAVPLGTTLVVIGGIGALAAGPLAVAGSSLTTTPWEDMMGDLEGTKVPPLRDGGIEASYKKKAQKKTAPSRSSTTPSAMLY